MQISNIILYVNPNYTYVYSNIQRDGTELQFVLISPLQQPGEDFMTGLRLSHWLKSEPFGSAKSLPQTLFTEGVSVETKLRPVIFVSHVTLFVIKIFY